MAKIQEEIIVIKVSKLLRDTDTETAQILNTQSVESLAAVIQELAGQNVLVEIAKE
jgi:hypothetical protein